MNEHDFLEVTLDDYDDDFFDEEWFKLKEEYVDNFLKRVEARSGEDSGYNEEYILISMNLCTAWLAHTIESFMPPESHSSAMAAVMINIQSRLLSARIQEH